MAVILLCVCVHMCLVAGGSALYATSDQYIAAASGAGGGRIGYSVAGAAAATHSYHPYRR